MKLPSSGAATVTMAIFGLPPGNHARVELQRGTCLAPGTDKLLATPPSTVDDQGRIDVTAVGDKRVASPLPGPASFALIVDVSSTDSRTVGCTDVNSKDPTSALRLYPVPGDRPLGNATVAYDAVRRTLNFDLTVTATRHGSTHAVMIRSGLCTAQGAIVYRLPDLKADATGGARTSPVIKRVRQPLPVTGWSIEVRALGSQPVATTGPQTDIDRPLLCGALRAGSP